MITGASLRTWQALEHLIALHGQSPTYTELGAVTGTSREAAHQVVRTLRARGLVDHVAGRSRSLRVLVASDRTGRTAE